MGITVLLGGKDFVRIGGKHREVEIGYKVELERRLRGSRFERCIETNSVLEGNFLLFFGLHPETPVRWLVYTVARRALSES